MPGSSVGSVQALHDEVEAQKDDPDEKREYGCLGWLLYIGSILLIILFLPLSIWGIVKVIPDYQRAVIFRLGRARKQDKMASGLFCIVPCIDDVSRAYHNVAKKGRTIQYVVGNIFFCICRSRSSVYELCHLMFHPKKS